MKHQVAFLSSVGISGLTTNAIAEKAGVSIGSLYQYFGGRDVILAQLLERDLAKKEEELIRLIETHSEEPLEVLIHRLIHRMREMIFEQPVVLRRLWVHAARLQRIVHILSHRRRLEQMLTNTIESRSELAHLEREHLERRVYVIVHAVMGVFQTILFEERDALEIDAIEGELENLVFHFLLAPRTLRATSCPPECSI